MLLLEIIIWMTKVLFMKVASELPFLTQRGQGTTRQNFDVKVRNLKKNSFS